MTKLKVTYFEPEDVLHLLIAEGTEVDSIELGPQITAELNANGELIGVEIFKASSFLRDFLLETVQAKLLNLTLAKTG